MCYINFIYDELSMYTMYTFNKNTSIIVAYLGSSYICTSFAPYKNQM